MSAVLKCYNDAACTDPVFFDVVSYSITLGKTSGYNGDDGDQSHQIIYVKNEGDVVAKNVAVREVGDISEYFFLSSESDSYKNSVVHLKDLEPGEVDYFIIHGIVPQGAISQSGLLEYDIEYYTLPVGTETSTAEYQALAHKTQYTGDENVGENPAGRPYGYGAYGEILYGQEGFIHKQVSLEGILLISGISHTYIKGSFSINTRYDGTEATIEDVQSYYTEKYMMMGCFDGPALPLWLDNVHEEAMSL